MRAPGEVQVLPRASELGVIGCHVCGLVCRCPGAGGEVDPHACCPRCGSTLHRRKPASYSRTWALLIAAFMMYLPANLLPIMRTASLNDIDDNTILTGVMELWTKGSPDLAVVVFTASILVPMLKFLVLGLLLITSHRQTGWAQRQLVDAGRFCGVIADRNGSFQRVEPG
jgi:paraquat-inducible protein A